jgi:hypothetical protein
MEAKIRSAWSEKGERCRGERAATHRFTRVVHGRIKTDLSYKAPYLPAASRPAGREPPRRGVEPCSVAELPEKP